MQVAMLRRFKMLGMSGKRVKYEVQKSNLTAMPGCEHGDCLDGSRVDLPICNINTLPNNIY